MRHQNTVENPQQWYEALLSTLRSLYLLYDQAAEHLRPSSPNGYTYYGETGKSLQHLSSQFERPYEFIQVSLDMLRIFFDPAPFGGLTFNQNPWYISQALPDRPFRLGYATLLSDPGESFNAFMQSQILPRLAELGYQISTCKAAFLAVCYGRNIYESENFTEFLVEVNSALQPFSFGTSHVNLAECIEMIRACCKDVQSARKRGSNYIGFAMDESLGERLRASVWLIEEPLRLQ